MKKNIQSCLLIAICGVLMLSCNKNYSEKYPIEKANDLKPVVVRKLEVSSEPVPIYASGIVASKSEAQLSFKTSGFIKSVNADEGQSVKKGALLAILDKTEINALVVQAENSYKKAERDLLRIQNLFADSAATLEQVQDLTTAKEIALSDLRIARFNQNYSEIRAPQDGRILKKFLEKGELVNSGSPVFSFAGSGSSSFIMRIGLADRDIVRLNLGDSALITFDAYPQAKFRATVTELGEEANPRSGSFEVELTIQEAALKLRNGFIGKAEIFPSGAGEYYKVAVDALVEGFGDEASIFLVTDEKTARKVLVKPQTIADGYFAVDLAAIPRESYVVVEGGAYLNEGDKLLLNKTL